MSDVEVTRHTEYRAPRPAVSQEPVTLIYDRGTVSLEQACRAMQIDHIVERYGDWAVTKFGLECLSTHYVIEAARLWGEWTLRHMREKRWVVYEDFAQAYEAARAYHRPKAALSPTVAPAPKKERATIPGAERRPRHESISNRLRFFILKRDHYACQLCGRTAAQGYQLHIDHKIARKNGGSNEENNLWVLCSVCNNGKGTESL